MPRQVCKTIYKFDELDGRAKEKARDWFRSGALLYEWWDTTLDDAKTCLALAGFRVDDIYFSGFSSQGDGACFEGAWYARDAKPIKVMKAHAPKDKTLHAIARECRRIARLRPDAGMRVKHRGRYSHEGCTEFFIDCDAPEFADDKRRTTAEWDALRTRDAEISTEIKEVSRDAMRWIYSQLRAEYEYQMSDEVVDENIRVNDYEFTEEGRRA